MNKVFDVAVIGGGPAGAGAAITASQLGLDVVLLEAGVFPRHKVCGEFVSAEAAFVLDSLLSSSELFANATRVSRARVFLDDRVIEFPVDPAASSISRHRLDLALWQAALGRDVCARDKTRVREAHRAGELFRIQLDEEVLQAKCVIDASGRWGNLVGRKPAHTDNWIGLKEHFFEETPSESCDLYFFDGGYCGVQPLGNGTVNAASMVRSDVARTIAAVFSLNPELQARTRSWRSATEPVSTAPLFFRPARTSSEGILLAGDAAAFLDPFAGDGISMALHSGRLAANAIAPYVRKECSLEAALRAYDQAHRKLIQPALKNAARLRALLQLPKALRLTAAALLKFPPVARIAVQKTRVRQPA